MYKGVFVYIDYQDESSVEVEVDETLLTLKNDGNTYEYYKSTMTNGKYDVDTDNETIYVDSPKAKKELKSYIEKAIDTMRVEVDGIGFDGDELSQNRMQRAITALITDETMPWKLYDNTVVTVNQTTIGEALREAGFLMASLWFCETTDAVDKIVSTDEIWLEKFKA